MTAPISNQASVLSSLPVSSVFTQDKDNDFQGDRQYHSCTYCVDWTRCLGYYQWKECKCRMLRKGVQDE